MLNFTPELINSFAALFTAIAVVGVMVQGWFIKTAIQEVSRHTNSMKDELVAEVRLASFAAGELSATHGKDNPINAQRKSPRIPIEEDSEAKG